MAEVDPILLAVGTVREKVKSEFVNRDTGQIEDRGHRITLLTRAGFVQFNLPVSFAGDLFEAGQPCVVWLRFKRWSFNGREGVTLIFDSFASGDVAKALAGELQAAAA